MQLHELKIKGKKDKKRVGRGGKRGTTAGKGTKGQKSRAGRRIRSAERDLIIRIPKKRGFRNKPVSQKPIPINLGEMYASLKTMLGEKGKVEVNKSILSEMGLIPKGYKGQVKVLGTGEIGAPVIIKGLLISESAKIKVEKAGGIIEE